MAQADAVDLIFAGLATPNGEGAYVRSPAVINQNNGQMSIISPEDLSRGVIRFQDQYRKLNFGAARQMLSLVEKTVQVEKITLLIREVIYPRLLIAVGAPQGTPIPELIWRLYATYAKSTPAEMAAVAAKTVEIFNTRWKELVTDEDDLTTEFLKDFYDSLPFPIGCTLRKLNQDNYHLAYHALPFWAAAHLKPKAAFDFGGNTGLMTTLMAANGAGRCLLVDFSTKILDFARWKDQRMGISNVEYLELDAAVAAVPAQFKERFDYGVCTEVMEHVLDVEKAVAAMAALLKKDGILFFSASFGHYPHPSHLRRNVMFAGKEDELLRRHGLQPVEVNFPIPLATNQKLYKKVTSSTSTHRH